MNEFDRWLAEQKLHSERQHEAQMPQVPKLTVASDVGVPLLQALAVGGVSAVCGGGLVGLIWHTWPGALTCAGIFGLGSFALCTVGFILEHRSVYTGPIRLAFLKFNASQPETPPTVETDWKTIHPYHKPIPLLPDAIMEHSSPAFADGEPETDDETRLLYDFVSIVWPTGKVSREHCRQLGYTRSTWEHYVGGVRGKTGESARGLLDRAGVVRKTSAGDWEINAPVGAALGWNKELRAYAKAMKAYRDGRDRTGQDTHVTADAVPTQESRG